MKHKTVSLNIYEDHLQGITDKIGKLSMEEHDRITFEFAYEEYFMFAKEKYDYKFLTDTLLKFVKEIELIEELELISPIDDMLYIIQQNFFHISSRSKLIKDRSLKRKAESIIGFLNFPPYHQDRRYNLENYQRANNYKFYDLVDWLCDDLEIEKIDTKEKLHQFLEAVWESESIKIKLNDEKVLKLNPDLVLKISALNHDESINDVNLNNKYVSLIAQELIDEQRENDTDFYKLLCKSENPYNGSKLLKDQIRISANKDQQLYDEMIRTVLPKILNYLNANTNLIYAKARKHSRENVISQEQKLFCYNLFATLRYFKLNNRNSKTNPNFLLEAIQELLDKTDTQKTRVIDNILRTLNF